ncbi:MAG: hypothetical protein J6334_07240 [Kiritimatiellae bacterium]|nr:hypothetical protein [Kiritimatiellia bacterium]
MDHKTVVGVVLVTVCSCFADPPVSWQLDHPAVWSREKGAASVTVEGSVIHVKNSSPSCDWSLHGIGWISVEPGDTFSFTCEVGRTGREGEANGAISVVTRDVTDKVHQWTYASLPCRAGETVVKNFMVPKGIASIEPRLIGVGISDIEVRSFSIRRTGHRTIAQQGDGGHAPLTISGKALSLSVDPDSGAWQVTDRISGASWKSLLPTGWFIETLSAAGQQALAMRLTDPENLLSYRSHWRLEPDRPELTVTLEGEPEAMMTGSVDYPAPLATVAGDRLIVPMNEGFSCPVEEKVEGIHRMIAYGGHGICMAFFGVLREVDRSGWMCILETPDDAAMGVARSPADTYVVGPSWEGQKRRFGYTRKARYVFFPKGAGGHVAMCKRYRAYAQAIGLFKPFSEKVKERPMVDRLLGAVNIWAWEPDKAALAKELKEAGIDRFLWSGGGNDEEVKALAAMPDVLVSRYDIYQDIYYPEQMRKLGKKGPGLNDAAYPQDINWAGPTSNEWRHAWGVKAPDGSWTYCAMMCDSKAIPYERKNVSEELSHRPYNTRFIDTTVASPWFECWNPAHPMTRSDSRHWKMELLRILGDEFKLVVGSETGHDASVPFCDYYEGMLSLGPYRVPDSGRNIQKIWTEVPERTANYQVGERYRLPLWELVYHECVCAHWYWGDYSNKLPALWKKRDLFNVLYGTVGMFMFNRKQWGEDKERFAASYRTFAPVARATGYAEMTDHRILTPDRSVQQTRFSNGIVVTVNFGEKPYPYGQTAIPPMDYRVEGM